MLRGDLVCSYWSLSCDLGLDDVTTTTAVLPSTIHQRLLPLLPQLCDLATTTSVHHLPMAAAAAAVATLSPEKHAVYCCAAIVFVAVGACCVTLGY